MPKKHHSKLEIDLNQLKTLNHNFKNNPGFTINHVRQILSDNNLSSDRQGITNIVNAIENSSTHYNDLVKHLIALTRSTSEHQELHNRIFKLAAERQDLDLVKAELDNNKILKKTKLDILENMVSADSIRDEDIEIFVTILDKIGKSEHKPLINLLLKNENLNIDLFEKFVEKGLFTNEELSEFIETIIQDSSINKADFLDMYNILVDKYNTLGGAEYDISTSLDFTEEHGLKDRFKILFNDNLSKAEPAAKSNEISSLIKKSSLYRLEFALKSIKNPITSTVNDMIITRFTKEFLAGNIEQTRLLIPHVSVETRKSILKNLEKIDKPREVGKLVKALSSDLNLTTKLEEKFAELGVAESYLPTGRSKLVAERLRDTAEHMSKGFENSFARAFAEGNISRVNALMDKVDKSTRKEIINNLNKIEHPKAVGELIRKVPELELGFKTVMKLVSSGVDYKSFSDYKFTKGQKEDIKTAYKESDYKAQKTVAKSDSLDLISRYKELIEIDKDYHILQEKQKASIEKDEAAKISKNPFKKIGNLTSDTKSLAKKIEAIESKSVSIMNEITALLKKDNLSSKTVESLRALAETLGEQQIKQPEKSILGKMIDGIKKIFSKELTVSQKSDMDKAFGNVDSFLLGEAKKHLKGIMKSEEQTDKNSHNLDRLKPESKGPKSK